MTAEGWHNDNAWDGGSRYFENPGPPGDGGLIGSWYGRLFNNAIPTGNSPWNEAYRERWRFLRAGPLSTSNIHAQIDQWAVSLQGPATRNFNRWTGIDPRFGGYQGEVDHLKNWLATRGAWIDSQFGTFLAPPIFSQPGGVVFAGFELELSAPEGIVYYTVNGPDPRGGNDLPVAEAELYSDPIVINGNSTVRARVRHAGEWSALIDEEFTTDVVALVVSEIMYNPRVLPEDGFVRSLYEYIEFYNAGDSDFDLSGVTIENPVFDFTTSSVTTLGPGEYVVVARNEPAFEERYGTDGILFAGRFLGGLSNTTQQIKVTGASGEVLMDFHYQDTWEPTTDGDGPLARGHRSVGPSPRPGTWARAGARVN